MSRSTRFDRLCLSKRLSIYWIQIRADGQFVLSRSPDNHNIRPRPLHGLYVRATSQFCNRLSIKWASFVVILQAQRWLANSPNEQMQWFVVHKVHSERICSQNECQHWFAKETFVVLSRWVIDFSRRWNYMNLVFIQHTNHWISLSTM